MLEERWVVDIRAIDFKVQEDSTDKNINVVLRKLYIKSLRMEFRVVIIINWYIILIR